MERGRRQEESERARDRREEEGKKEREGKRIERGGIGRRTRASVSNLERRNREETVLSRNLNYKDSKDTKVLES